MPRPRRALLTGATGNWGTATLREFRDHPDVTVRAFALDTSADRAALAEFADLPNLEVVYGDLTRYDDVARAVADVDVILHVAAVVSPLADERPALARRVNIGSVQNIIRAVMALPDPAAVDVIGVGSVAETGDRQSPVHWGRVGDPLRVSEFDEYGQSKVIAEKLLIESGIPRWAWLRQTGIFHPKMLEIRDPIMTHSPFTAVMEWVSAEDSARLLARIAEGGLPEEFWGGVYNIGGGDGWRLTNWQLQEAISGATGVEDVRTWYDRNWFATQNFHGHWYTDSDDLARLVPFRKDDFGDALTRAVATLPAAARNAGKVPPWIIKNFVMKPLTKKPRGTMHAIANGDVDKIRAYFGSLEKWKAIGDWSTFVPPSPSRTPSYLEHGYDETTPRETWDADVYRGVADFRGGQLVTDAVGVGDYATPLVWRCADGHLFAGSGRLILTAGHWCPECVREAAQYETQAERNPFLKQLYGGTRAAV